jgi:hypothetical protein
LAAENLRTIQRGPGEFAHSKQASEGSADGGVLGCPFPRLGVGPREDAQQKVVGNGKALSQVTLSSSVENLDAADVSLYPGVAEYVEVIHAHVDAV